MTTKLAELELDNQRLRNTANKSDQYQSAFQSDSNAFKMKIEELERQLFQAGENEALSHTNLQEQHKQNDLLTEENNILKGKIASL